MRRMTHQRKPPKERTAELLEAALEVAAESGYLQMTRQAIAERVGVTPALVTHRFSTMAELRRLVMRQAVKREVLAIIAQGLAVKDAHAMRAPADLKRKALLTLQTQ